MNSSQKPIPDDQLLRIDDLVKLTTLSKSCINLWVSQGRFPRPATLSSTVHVWQMAQIRRWLDGFVFDPQEGL